VIDDTDQLRMGIDHSITSIVVDVNFMDLISGSMVGPVSGITMTYQSLVDMWTINVSDVASVLMDKRTYVAMVSATTYPSPNLRPFKINEFAVDNDRMEDTWVNLPYQVEISSPKSYIKWYDATANFSAPDHCEFYAEAYQGGVGTVAATDTALVTHRGPVLLNAIPIPPVLATPTNTATGISITPTLTWTFPVGFATFRIQVSTDNTFATSLIDASSITATSYNATGLANSTLYYWMVSASNVNGTSSYSTVFSFTTTP